MKVDETLSFDQYWKDPRFQGKKPRLNGSEKQAFGDNIYHKHPTTGKWQQANSHHSLADGCPNKANVVHDTQTDRVLIGYTYAYWGRSGPKIPISLRSELCKIGPGHKCNFPQSFVDKVTAWLLSTETRGYAGRPLDWD
jgi:hypothetical protein